jgi:hypothetical protein
MFPSPSLVQAFLQNQHALLIALAALFSGAAPALAWPSAGQPVGPRSAGTPHEPTAKVAVEPDFLEVRCTDDSVFKLILRDERVELTTPYGKLVVPSADIRRIEFATRIPPDDARKVKGAIAQLGTLAFAEREAAAAELLRQKEKAYQALLVAAKSTDTEVSARAQNLLQKLTAAIPADRLVTRPYDILFTADSKIAGRIDMTAFKVRTTQFGDGQLALADLRILSRGPTAPSRTAIVQQDPGTLANMQVTGGQTYYFRVAGAGGGVVWGTDVYTTDSSLAAAAVHAGVLPMGQNGVVKVTIVPAPANFAGTTRNGITSNDWGAYPIAFQVSRPEEDLILKDAPAANPNPRFNPLQGGAFRIAPAINGLMPAPPPPARP